MEITKHKQHWDKDKMEDNRYWKDIKFLIKLANKNEKLSDFGIKYIEDMEKIVASTDPNLLTQKQYDLLYKFALGKK